MQVAEASAPAVKAKTLVVTNALATFKAEVAVADGPVTAGDDLLDAEVVTKEEAGVVSKEEVVDMTLGLMAEEDHTVDEARPIEVDVAGGATR